MANFIIIFFLSECPHSKMAQILGNRYCLQHAPGYRQTLIFHFPPAPPQKYKNGVLALIYHIVVMDFVSQLYPG